MNSPTQPNTYEIAGATSITRESSKCRLEEDEKTPDAADTSKRKQGVSTLTVT
jgi:hypothetical protein